MSEKSCQESLEWPADRVRQTFIDFFKEKNHTYWPSSPVVPHDDPTLLFANAGMNQFKPLFLGTTDPNLPLSKLKRACNSQKCIRAGGKHNDLDDVGKDVYHHTFFEMLGNWSFGDYFKKEAIEWAWECLTLTYGLDENRLYATYFEGDKELGLAPDEEAKKIWRKYLPEERILPFGCKDNFWEMGETGPCGPCTEIHYDRIGGRDAGKIVNADQPDVIEIWNNVFIQFNRETGGVLKELPNKHVDTGMGFERLTSILQGKDSNYDTDVFLPIFKQIQIVTRAREYTGKVGKEDKDTIDMAYRVVADHIRTLTFAISDGAVPSNDGRGYVLRRILRRGVRYGQQILGAKPGFFHQLVPVVVENLKGAFPELENRTKFVMDVLNDEETAFNKTLDKGLREFNKKAKEILDSKSPKIFPGTTAFLLYSAMGFPVDLTQLMAEEAGLVVDMKEYYEKMEEDKAKSVAAEIARRAAGGTALIMAAEQTSALSNKGIEVSISEDKYKWNHSPRAKIVALFAGLGKGPLQDGFVSEAVEGETIGVILDKTSFYAEQGGQVYDTGHLKGDNFSAEVLNVQTYGGYILHTCHATGKISLDSTVECHVDYDRRSKVAPNHTMTHVLNFALRNVLCGGLDNKTVAQGLCDQKGSFVDDEKLRFDFAWTGPLKPNQLEVVENIVNSTIQNKLPVFAQVAPLADASKIKALRSVFGERYPDPVRVLSVGIDLNDILKDPENEKWIYHSIEFCGGTHLTNTEQAEAFCIIEETGIAKGIRRIIAVTKEKAHQAKAAALEFEAKVEEVSRFEPLQLEKEVKRLIPILDTMEISVTDAHRIRNKINSYTKLINTFKKNEAAKMNSHAKQLGVEAGEAAKAAGNDKVIVELPNWTDNKTLTLALTSAFAVHKGGKKFAAFSKDPETNKYSCIAIMPGTSGEAKVWLDSVLSNVGGSASGNKGEKAVGFGTGMENADKA
eukprot:CAMPEP_0171475884 /NCGR_PEP_ID=MMETSP0946-20130122/3259_1 /TAXON_ID=109269 /ORGANISM="Vaucheria litorea, Strain CCMP2940" /LENGTH=961 /DNA_ID=CAMNT_0012006037 /DNA_START=8 /DNA_END=2889 /DNA_ORIENTATION=+